MSVNLTDWVPSSNSPKRWGSGKCVFAMDPVNTYVLNRMPRDYTELPLDNKVVGFGWDE